MTAPVGLRAAGNFCNLSFIYFSLRYVACHGLEEGSLLGLVVGVVGRLAVEGESGLHVEAAAVDVSALAATKSHHLF
jgi:hypothetical protein